jgi:hypothetical protein
MTRRLLAALLALIVSSTPVFATGNRTEWTAGNGVGTTWTAAINSADMTSLASAHAVMGTPVIDNTTALDLYAIVSAKLAISSATPAAGDFVAIYLASLSEDGSTYGDGNLTSGTSVAWAPPWQPVCTFPLNNPAGAQTVLNGQCPPFLIPPGKWKFVIYLGTASIALSSGTQTVDYTTYNQFLNN